MRLACAALLLAAVPGIAQEQAESARRLVLDASRALQASNAALFLSYFDKKETPGFERLRENLLALLQEKDVASSVDVALAGSEQGVTQFDVDWLLQITPIADVGAAEERRQKVRVDVRSNGKPKIVRLEPVDFFRVAIVAGPAPGP